MFQVELDLFATLNLEPSNRRCFFIFDLTGVLRPFSQILPFSGK